MADAPSSIHQWCVRHKSTTNVITDPISRTLPDNGASGTNQPPTWSLILSDAPYPIIGNPAQTGAGVALSRGNSGRKAPLPPWERGLGWGLFRLGFFPPPQPSTAFSTQNQGSNSSNRSPIPPRTAQIQGNHWEPDHRSRSCGLFP